MVRVVLGAQVSCYLGVVLDYVLAEGAAARVPTDRCHSLRGVAGGGLCVGRCVL